MDSGNEPADMTYPSKSPPTRQELRDAYPQIVDESMRCGGPGIDLHPDDGIAHVAVEHGYAYVARDESGMICGAALIWPDGHVKWLTLPVQDSEIVMEALFDFATTHRGVTLWGNVETPALHDRIAAHNAVTDDEGVLRWR